MREKEQPLDRASERASIVLPTGDILDQQVAATHQGHHRKLHLRALANDHSLDVFDELLGGFSGVQGAPPSV